jgi:conjugative transfer signal peptidase TraF
MLPSPFRESSPQGQRVAMTVRVLTVLAVLLMLDSILPIGLSYNHSKSLPRGLYWHQPVVHPVHRGQLVCFRFVPPEWVKTRRYFPDGTLLCKSVLGLPGDRIVRSGVETQICTANSCVSAGASLTHDSQGRPLPEIGFPGIIPAGSLYLSSTRVPNSFDSRYLGLIAESSLVHETHPLLTE